MTVNAKIKASDYNDIRNAVTSVLGTGAGDFGYGQPIRSSVVNLDSKVSINDWQQLKYDIQSVYRHQTNADPPTIAEIPTEGSKIRSNATNSPYTQYNTLKNTLQTNRFTTPPEGRRAISTPVSRSTAWPGAYGEYWRTEIVSTVVVEWTTAEQARFFFNAGGEIRISSRRIAPSSSTLNNATQGNSWGQLLTNVGTRAFGGNKPGTGTGATQTLNGQNFFRLTNQYTDPWVNEALSSPYSNSRYQIYAKGNVGNNTSGGARRVEFEVVFNDAHNGTGGGPDRIDGTFEVNVSSLTATGALIPTGIFTIEAPTITVTPPIPRNASATAVYTITADKLSVNEGETVTFSVATSGLLPGTTLYWSCFGGPNVTSADFSNATGTVSINAAGNASIQITTTVDFLLEGTEFFFLEIKEGSQNGNIVATSRSINIGDTSRTFTFGVTTSIASYNLRNRAITAGWNQIDRLEFILYTPGRLYGTSNSNYDGSGNSPNTHATVGGLIINGAYPSGLIIRNYGAIVGAGGVGGRGATSNGSAGQNGTHGGAGLVVVAGTTSTFGSLNTIYVYNTSQSVISGGGGGGGGGTFAPSGQGGGGGGGAPFGAGAARNGQTAQAVFGGAGGTVSVDVGFHAGGAGGEEGDSGANGSSSRYSGYFGSPGQGGNAGYSIVGTSLITLISESGSQVVGPQIFATSN